MIVTDSRDGQSYAVAKLEDGNCWMLQNLKLGKLSDTLTLTQDDSNVSSAGFVLDGKSADGIMTAETVVVDGTDVPYQNNSPEYYCTNDYGCYYNWYTATAGSGTTWVSSGDLDYTICPKGWSMPTSQEWIDLTTAYSSNALNMLVVNPTTTTENINGAQQPGLLLGGRYGSYGNSWDGRYGNYWSRSAYDLRSGYLFEISPSGVSPANEFTKYVASAVRCLFSIPQS